MEMSGIFNSNNGDRVYDATDFATYFGDLVGNGIFRKAADSLKVIADTGMNIIVQPGSGWINGYHYRNTTPLRLTAPTAHGVNPRIDRVVMRLDHVARSINFSIKAGVPAATPEPPDLDRNADMHELSGADVLVERGAVSITANNITDTRGNPDLCGWVSSFDGLDDIVDDLRRDIGNLHDLETDVSSSLVNAINEIKQRIDTFSPAPEVNNITLFGGGNVIITGSSASIESNGSSKYLRIHGQCQINNIGNDGTHEVWSLPAMPSNIISISTNGDYVALCTEVGQVLKIGALTGQIIWDEFTPDPLTMCVISDFGNVYVLTPINSPRHFYKLSSDDGSVLWAVNSHTTSTHPARISSDFAVGADEKLHYCRWSQGIAPTSGGGSSAPQAVYIVLDPDGTSIYSANVCNSTSTTSQAGTISGLALDGENRLFYWTSVSGLRGPTGTNSTIFQGAFRHDYQSHATPRFIALSGTNINASYPRGMIFLSNYFQIRTNSVRRFNLNGGLLQTLPFTHNVVATLDHDENSNLYYASTDFRSIMKFDLSTNTQTTEYTFDGGQLISRMVCGGAGQYYVRLNDNSIVGLRTGFEPFTSSQVQSKKLMGFETPLPITHPIPIRGTPDFESLGAWAQYDLEIRADGVYTRASSTQTIPGDAKIRFDGVFLLH